MSPPSGGSRRFACTAQNMPSDHNESSAYFLIPQNSPHGMLLSCSHPVCSKGQKRFRYCAVCQMPVQSRLFPTQHYHNIPLGSHVTTSSSGPTPSTSSSNTSSSPHILAPPSFVSFPARASTSADAKGNVDEMKGEAQVDVSSVSNESPDSSNQGNEDDSKFKNGEISNLTPKEMLWLKLLHKRPDFQNTNAVDSWINTIIQVAEVNEMSSSSEGRKRTASHNVRSEHTSSGRSSRDQASKEKEQTSDELNSSEQASKQRSSSSGELASNEKSSSEHGSNEQTSSSDGQDEKLPYRKVNTKDHRRQRMVSNNERKGSDGDMSVDSEKKAEKFLSTQTGVVKQDGARARFERFDDKADGEADRSPEGKICADSREKENTDCDDKDSSDKDSSITMENDGEKNTPTDMSIDDLDDTKGAPREDTGDEKVDCLQPNGKSNSTNVESSLKSNSSDRNKRRHLEVGRSKEESDKDSDAEMNSKESDSNGSDSNGQGSKGGPSPQESLSDGVSTIELCNNAQGNPMTLEEIYGFDVDDVFGD